jgi:hypothetical protein
VTGEHTNVHVVRILYNTLRTTKPKIVRVRTPFMSPFKPATNHLYQVIGFPRYFITVKTWLTFSGRWSSQQQHTDTASSFSYNTVTVQLYSFLLPVK